MMSTWTICIVIQKSWWSSKNWLSFPLQCMSLDNLPSWKRCARMEEAVLIWKGQCSWEWGHFLLRVARGTSHTSLWRLIRRGCEWLMQVVITCIRSLRSTTTRCKHGKSRQNTPKASIKKNVANKKNQL